MGSEFTEDHRATKKEKDRDDPVLDRESGFVPKPDVINQRVAVSLDQVIDGIVLDDRMVLLRQNFHRPEDWGEPESELDDHRDDMPKITEEYDDRAGDPRHPENKYNCSEEIIGDLKPVCCRGIAVIEKHPQRKENKKPVDRHLRDDLDDGEERHTEDDFFHQKAVGQDRLRRALQTLGKEKPRHHSSHQPEDKGKVVHRHALEPDLKHEPEDQNHRRGLDECPNDPEIVPHIAGFKIVFGQIDEQPAAAVDVAQKAVKRL